MLEITLVGLILIFIIALYYGVNRDKKKEQTERNRITVERRNRITSQPAQRDSINETVYNRSNLQNERSLSTDLEEKTRIVNTDINILELNTEVYFKDNWGRGVNDYSYMSAAEARGEISYLKSLYGYIDWEDYGGLLDAIASEKDEKYLEIIKSKTPEEVEKWFHKNIRNDIKMSQSIWIEVGKVLKPIHEPDLLDKMEHCSARSIESFVKNRKLEGYFFSQKAYDVANDIYYGRYNPVQIRKEQNKPILSIKRNLNKYQKRYDEAVQVGDMEAMAKAKLKLNEFRKKLDELTEK